MEEKTILMDREENKAEDINDRIEKEITNYEIVDDLETMIFSITLLSKAGLTFFMFASQFFNGFSA